MQKISLTCRLGIIVLFQLGFVGAAFGQYLSTVPVSDELKPGFDSITVEQCEEWLSILAGPNFKGRGTGQPGYTKAAHWVSGKVAEWGLEPMGSGGSYFQMLPMKRRTPLMAESKIEGPEGLIIEGENEIGFQRYANHPQVSGQVVFVSASGESPSLPDDRSLRDKVVVLVSDSAADFRAQIMVARQRPVAVIRITSEKPQTRPQVVRGSQQRSNGTWCSISQSAAERLIKSVGGDTSWIETPEENGVVVNEVDAELKVTVRLREENVVVPNVVAWLEGSDPDVNDEYIVLGAHLDHLGTRGEAVYPGADDNGSGSTAILSVAKAMAQNPVKPRRSVMFIWFAAEEIGLVGSAHFVDKPTKPLDKCICMFNTDMVGRNEESNNETAEENEGTIHLIGSKRADPDWHNLILEANKHVGFRFEYDQESVFGRSDQASFYRAGIPVAFIFGGFHPDYHQPTDKVEKINYKKIVSAAKLFYLSIYNAAEHGPFEPVEEDE